MVGLQGSGKTTSSVKLASFLKKKYNKNPILIAADLQRPGAVDQLQILSKKVNIDFYSDEIKDIVSVVKNGLLKADSRNHDVVIIDTAGRLHIDDDLMDELKQVISISSPDEILYVADGMTGQDAVNSSNIFNEKIGISGIILTKMDGDSRGGAALSICKVTGMSIKYIGTGESLDDIEIFHPDRLANRILGMGDVVSLVEKAQEVIDKNEAEKLTKKIVSKEFNFEDFSNQMKQIQKMGSIKDLIKMVPGTNKLPIGDINEKQLVWIDAMISSMTIKERKNPNIINGSRRKRIAKGSGRSLFEINQLLKNFFQMKKIMAGFNKKGFNRMPFKFIS